MVSSTERGFWRRFRRHRPGMFGLAVLLLLGLSAIGAGAIERALGIDAETVDLFARLAPPDAERLLGADELGRDFLARLLRGGQVSLAIGLIGAGLASTIGAAVGLLAGYAGGRVDAALMRLTDAVIALPLLPLLIVLAALDPAKLGLPAGLSEGGPGGVARIVAIVALFGWTTTARLARASALSVRQRDYVRAARALGCSDARIARRHVLPALAPPIAVAFSLSVGQVILAESVLSFLGLGVEPPTPSWGAMLAGAETVAFEAPRLVWAPGALIFTTVLAFNLVGDAAQDALDPREPARL